MTANYDSEYHSYLDVPFCKKLGPRSIMYCEGHDTRSLGMISLLANGFTFYNVAVPTKRILFIGE